jgi:hypothetical protein
LFTALEFLITVLNFASLLIIYKRIWSAFERIRGLNLASAKNAGALWSQLAKYQAFTCWVLSDAAVRVCICIYARVLLLASVYIRNPGQTQSYVVDIRARCSARYYFISS